MAALGYVVVDSCDVHTSGTDQTEFRRKELEGRQREWQQEAWGAALSDKQPFCRISIQFVWVIRNMWNATGPRPYMRQCTG